MENLTAFKRNHETNGKTERFREFRKNEELYLAFVIWSSLWLNKWKSNVNHRDKTKDTQKTNKSDNIYIYEGVYAQVRINEERF